MRRPACLILSLLLAGCAPTSSQLPASAVPAGPGIALVTEPVSGACAEAPCGGFRYAGGIVVTSSDTTRLHGLSGLVVDAEGRLTAVTDDGDLFRARLARSPAGRLVGLTEGRIEPLRGPDGAPLQGKSEGDAEGLAVLADGSRLVSFERNHRIWRYPADGGPPRAVSSPQAPMPENGGLEALMADPERGADAYVTGAEESGQTWACHATQPCVALAPVEKDKAFGLVAGVRLSQGRTAWMLRAFDPLRGARIELRITDTDGAVIDTLRLERPDTVDNFEGLAAVPTVGGAVRLYLVSDDNFQPVQRTLLLAYDWRP